MCASGAMKKFGPNMAIPEWPLLSKRALAEMERRLTPDSLIFEWGSGGSTVWFAQRAARVVSVEHDTHWYGQMYNGLAWRDIRNVELLYFPELAQYFKAIQNRQELFDLILVDGRARCRCVREAIPRLRMGGTLVIDDAWRPEYTAALALMDGWPCVAWHEAWNQRAVQTKTAVYTKTEQLAPETYDALLAEVGIPDEEA